MSVIISDTVAKNLVKGSLMEGINFVCTQSATEESKLKVLERIDYILELLNGEQLQKAMNKIYDSNPIVLRKTAL